MYRLTGIILVALSAASFGTLAIFSRFAYADGMDAVTILFLRFSMAALLMLGLLIQRRERLPRGLALLRLIGMGAVGYVGQAYAYLTALKYASAGTVALLLYLYPMIVTMLSALFLREKITSLKILALGLALPGTALVVGPSGGQALGIMLAISAALIYSVYIIVGAQVVRQVSAVQSSFVIFTSAGVVYGTMAAFNGLRLPGTDTGWMAIGAIVIVATVVPVVTFLAGMERIGPTNASMLSTLEPVVTVLLAMLLLNESLKPVTLIGGGLILAAVLILVHSELRQKRQVTQQTVPSGQNDLHLPGPYQSV